MSMCEVNYITFDSILPLLISEFEKSHYPDVYSRDRLAAIICVPEPRVQVEICIAFSSQT